MDLKTPVSLLQEYLVKEGVLPSYQLVDFENLGTHAPTFGYEVKAKGVTAVGKGRSKKEAKQEAAKLLLVKLKGETIWKEEIPLNSRQGVKENLVGALQEYCYQKCISLPHYEFVNDVGSPISHSFVVKCNVASYSTLGTGSTKQHAKHLAAQAMLSKFKNDEVNVSDISTGTGSTKQQAKHLAAQAMLSKFKNDEVNVSDISTGTGSTKQQAKHLAAQAMLSKFKNDEVNVSDIFIGTGSTKQQAKHLAAQAMLPKFKNDEVNANDISKNAIEARKELIQKAQDKTKEAFEKTLHERKDGAYSSENPVENMFNFSDYFMSRIGQRSSTLASLKDTDEEEIERHKNPEGLLDIIMKELDFNLKFEPMKSRTSDHLCNLMIMELSINCIGSGRSAVEARKKAALNVLKVLVLMSQP